MVWKAVWTGLFGGLAEVFLTARVSSRFFEAATSVADVGVGEAVQEPLSCLKSSVRSSHSSDQAMQSPVLLAEIMWGHRHAVLSAGRKA